MKITSSMTALLLGGAAAAGAGYAALAQGITPLPNPAGTERITVVPVAPGGFAGGAQAEVNINQIRNATGYVLFSTASIASGTITVSTATNEILLNVQPNTSTWVLPAKGVAFDAEQFQFCNVTNANFATNTINIVAGNSTSIQVGSTTVSSIAATTLTSLSCIELVYSNNTNLWYRIR